MQLDHRLVYNSALFHCKVESNKSNSKLKFQNEVKTLDNLNIKVALQVVQALQHCTKMISSTNLL